MIIVASHKVTRPANLASRWQATRARHESGEIRQECLESILEMNPLVVVGFALCSTVAIDKVCFLLLCSLGQFQTRLLRTWSHFSTCQTPSMAWIDKSLIPATGGKDMPTACLLAQPSLGQGAHDIAVVAASAAMLCSLRSTVHRVVTTSAGCQVKRGRSVYTLSWLEDSEAFPASSSFHRLRCDMIGKALG